METCSSGEDLIVKTRKPYTITKQRERWTEGEHSRFLEALKLYGRAWQRIEEHIGTKTAVQIRSHAQKFFTKLEKEAQLKGVPLGQAHNIDIPPPRPKRKPSSPYPRKICGGAISSSGEAKDETSLKSVSSLCPNQQVPDMERDAPFEKHVGTETLRRINGASEDGNCSEILNLFQNNPCVSITSASKSSANPCLFSEFAPLVKELKDTSTINESSSIVKGKEPKENTEDYKDLDIGKLKGLCINSKVKLTQEEGEVGLKRPQEPGMPLKPDLQSVRSYPKHVPVYFIDGSKEECGRTTYSVSTNSSSLTNQVGENANPNPFTNLSISATTKQHTRSSLSSIHQEFPTLSPFNQFGNIQDAYRSLLNISSTFSSLIISALLQNPAAHAAANLAASFWPSADLETSIDSTSEAIVGGIPVRQVNPSPSMEAIAATTVAAASAWWATHGLLPLCYPHLHTGFTFVPAPATTIPTTETTEAPAEKKERKGDCTQNNAQKDQQVLDPKFYQGTQCATSRSFPMSSPYSDGSGGGERLHDTILISPLVSQLNSVLDAGFHNSDEARSKKKIDRSSCGSNTTSSSEVETDTMLEKVEEEKELHKEANSGETNNRRFRSSGNINESWKEVSEEGRLAFQALFSRVVLPQSFSSPHTEDGTGGSGRGKEAIALPVDLNSDAFGETDLNGVQCFNKDEFSVRSNDNLDKGFLIGHGKLKTRRTGFKPYKRCSMEARESRGAVSEERGNKKIRLQEESSTL